jgi:glycosyltransferase involved in cell wall biosynthesis/ubiquinone/menaquinone biosynthesis C-methylase UbiE/uncharacterized protein YbaR (Trm112 family)
MVDMMRQQLLKYLRCPKCESNLTIEEQYSDDTEIICGQLKCELCASRYKIQNGMPFLYIDDNNWINKAKEADGWVELHKSKGIYDQTGVHIDFTLPYFKEEPWIKVSKMFDICLDMLKLNGSEKILDLGAGRGWASKQFTLKGCESFAMDIVADDQVRLGRSKAIMENSKIYYERIIGDSENIPFKDEIFDIIFCSASLHHTSDIGTLLSNIYRTLKYGGTFIAINEPCISIFEDESNALKDSEELKYDINEKRPNLLNYYSALLRAGFVEINIFPYQIYKMKSNDLKRWHNHYRITEPVDSLLQKNLYMCTGPLGYLVNSVLMQYGGEVVISAKKINKQKIAFVVQRYGLEVNGGAELLCRHVAEHLSRYFDIEIITTCAIDYITWENEYASGKQILNGLTVWRFPVDHPRDIFKFNKYSEIIYGNPNRGEDDEIKWMELQGPFSTKLFDFIDTHKNDYTYFIFFTYLYCTTFFGLPIVKDKAILVPTAHDEPPIYLKIFENLFIIPRAICYNTEEEKQFVNKTFKNNHIINDIIGVGVEIPVALSPDTFRVKYNIRNNFIIYIGRIDESKGCGELFDHFIRYKEETKSDLKLILLGKSAMKIPEYEDIIQLGFVSDEDKFNGIAASDLIIMPSRYESLSIVLMEAWACKKAVLVNGSCDVLKGHCLRSNGGLWYENREEFKECLDLLISDDRLRVKMGENGKKYVEENYSWSEIEEKYIKLFYTLQSTG